MKKIALISITLLFAFHFSPFTSVSAQDVPQGFTYQAVVRNAQGAPVANSQVSVRIALLQGSALGSERYAELHTPTTDAAGLFAVVVGQGTALVNCMMEDCIDWADGPWFLHSEVDPAGGNNYTLSTTQQLMAVPYALFAANVLHDTVHIRDSVVVHVHDSIVVHIHDSVVVHIHDSIVVHDSIIVHIYDSIVPHDTVAAAPYDANGALSGLFSVSATKQVRFSRGNLQYHAVDSLWRFAEQQIDFIGSDNSNISATYDGWIDLFGWGTGANPTEHSSSNSAYSSFTDWGTNAISNGGDSVGRWYTMTKNEQDYIFYGRDSATAKWAMVTIDSTIKGLIVLPDEWTLPAGLTFVAGDSYSWDTDHYTLDEWERLEQAGAVFLPAAGKRYPSYAGSVGSYWSCSQGQNAGYNLDFAPHHIPKVMPLSLCPRYYGYSVRLVTTVE